MARIQQILVVGGGVGRLADGLLSGQDAQQRGAGRASRSNWSSRRDIGLLGVGEATFPSIRGTLAAIGLDERRFLAGASATYKQGIRYVDWVRPAGRAGRRPLLPPVQPAQPARRQPRAAALLAAGRRAGRHAVRRCGDHAEHAGRARPGAQARQRSPTTGAAQSRLPLRRGGLCRGAGRAWPDAWACAATWPRWSGSSWTQHGAIAQHRHQRTRRDVGRPVRRLHRPARRA